MRRADAAAIASGTPGEVLMERAGLALARSAIRLAGGRYGKRALVLCGKGNNGGDGLVAARALEREGLKVRVVRVFEEGHAPPPAGYDVVVDAIFGTGFRGAPEGGVANVIESLRGHQRVVAADIPSGVDGTTGAVAGPAVRAAATVAMGAEKLGSALSPGASYAGTVEVADIGIAIPAAAVHLVEDSDVRDALPGRVPHAHKRSGGAVAILAGSEATKGAALLCARGAGRMGSGYVTLGSTRSVVAAAPVSLPEILTRTVTDGDVLGPEALDSFGDVLERAGSLAIGPGLGTGDAQRTLVTRLLREIDVPVVLDADALNVLDRDAAAGRSAPAIVTPHPAELGRLLEVPVEEVVADRLAAARAAAERFRCVVVAKGHRTVVAEPGRAVVVPAGGPELATAGTGDVLTGAVAALLAAGVEPFAAGWCAAYVHGVAGGLAPPGALAWDVAEALGTARSRFTLGS
jgi:hydroxyethylthiazole kinase-like uncharacterized protein yjeF